MKQIQTNSKTRRYIIHFIRTTWLVCLLFVSIGSITPGTPHFQQFLANDKLLHLIAYAGLAFLPPIFLESPRLHYRCAIFLVLWGILMEGIQGLTPTRTASFADILADVAGVALGTWLGRLAAKRLRIQKTVK